MRFIIYVKPVLIFYTISQLLGLITFMQAEHKAYITSISFDVPPHPFSFKFCRNPFISFGYEAYGLILSSNSGANISRRCTRMRCGGLRLAGSTLWPPSTSVAGARDVATPQSCVPISAACGAWGCRSSQLVHPMCKYNASVYNAQIPIVDNVCIRNSEPYGTGHKFSQVTLSHI